MKLLKWTSLLLIAALLVACSSPTTITVKTQPDKVDVYLRKLNGGDTAKKVGVTPLTLKAVDLKIKYNVDGPVFLVLKKDGYIPTSTLITDIHARELDFVTELKPNDYLEMSDTVDSIVNDLFKCQTLVRKKQYNEARTILVEIRKQFPFLSVVHELEGGIHLLEKKYGLALESFGLAAKYDPENVEALRLKKALEKKFNIKSGQTTKR